MANGSIPQLDDSRTITLKRTQYAVCNKPTWRQRIAARFRQTVALVAIAVTVAAVVVSVATPGLLPIPA